MKPTPFHFFFFLCPFVFFLCCAVEQGWRSRVQLRRRRWRRPKLLTTDVNLTAAVVGILRDDDVHLEGRKPCCGVGGRRGAWEKDRFLVLPFCFCCTENITEMGVIYKAASVHDLLLIVGLVVKSFVAGANYRTYWASMFVGRIVECGRHFSVPGGDSLGFRQVGWPSAGFASRFFDSGQLIG